MRRDGAGFSQGSCAIANGTGLQILALPEPGYRVGEIIVTSGGKRVASIQGRSCLAFVLEENSQIQVIFEKAA